MPDTRLRTIIAKLTEQTKAGKIQWTSAAPAGFTTSFPDYSVTVASTRSEFAIVSSSGHKLVIVNGQGEVIESLDIYIGHPGHDELRALYKVARRNAAGVDKALDELLELLDK